jgi:hypothetical protein
MTLTTGAFLVVADAAVFVRDGDGKTCDGSEFFIPADVPTLIICASGKLAFAAKTTTASKVRVAQVVPLGPA